MKNRRPSNKRARDWEPSPTPRGAPPPGADEDKDESPPGPGPAAEASPDEPSLPRMPSSLGPLLYMVQEHTSSDSTAEAEEAYAAADTDRRYAAAAAWTQCPGLDTFALDGAVAGGTCANVGPVNPGWGASHAFDFDGATRGPGDANASGEPGRGSCSGGWRVPLRLNPTVPRRARPGTSVSRPPNPQPRPGRRRRRPGHVRANRSAFSFSERVAMSPPRPGAQGNTCPPSGRAPTSPVAPSPPRQAVPLGDLRPPAYDDDMEPPAYDDDIRPPDYNDDYFFLTLWAAAPSPSRWTVESGYFPAPSTPGSEAGGRQPPVGPLSWTWSTIESWPRTAERAPPSPSTPRSYAEPERQPPSPPPRR